MFQLSLDYWNTVLQRKNLGNLEVEMRTSFVFAALKNDQIVNYNGDLEKLKYIISAMNYLYEHFDPNPYIAKKTFILKNYLIGKQNKHFYVNLVYLVLIISVLFCTSKNMNAITWFFFNSNVPVKLLFNMCN